MPKRDGGRFLSGPRRTRRVEDPRGFHQRRPMERHSRVSDRGLSKEDSSAATVLRIVLSLFTPIISCDTTSSTSLLTYASLMLRYNHMSRFLMARDPAAALKTPNRHEYPLPRMYTNVQYCSIILGLAVNTPGVADAKSQSLVTRHRSLITLSRPNYRHEYHYFLAWQNNPSGRYCSSRRVPMASGPL